MDRDGWNERYRGKDLLWAAEPNRFVAAECAGLPPGRALDLACGEGRNAVWLAGRGWQVTAVDFSDVAVAKGHELAAQQGVTVEFAVADLLDYVPAPGAFDLVVLAYLQVPAADRAVIWPRAVTAVAPRGTFLLVGHARENLRHGVGGPRDESVLYEAGDVVPLLDGLTVDRAEQVLRPATRDDGTEGEAIDVLVRATRR